MIWAIDALSSGRPDSAAPLLRFPPQAVDQTPGSPYAIHKWELETLLVHFFLESCEGPLSNGTSHFDCNNFSHVATLINRLRKLEDVESGLYLREGNLSIFGEMHRIAQRQFHWQQGYFNVPQFYRYSFIYAQGECGEYFERTYGFPITELNFVGFVFYAHAVKYPWFSSAASLPDVGLTDDLMRRALPLLVISVEQARAQTREIVETMNARHGRAIPTAYLPSIFRRYPLVNCSGGSEQLIAPIPELLLIRVTSGLYYDLVRGGEKVLNDANDRFEEYCAKYIAAMMRRFDVSREYSYELRKGISVQTPDVLVRDGNQLVLAIECKATKLTYLAQFAEDPFEAERKQYLQIAKAVFQLWRFFSHVRRGLVHEDIAVDAPGVVLTLDSFLVLSRELQNKVIKEASALADQEGNILAEDRRHIIFCSIDDLEIVLSRSTEDIFLGTLRAAQSEQYRGWRLREINREVRAELGEIEPKKFPFELGTVLPWWARVKELKLVE